MSSSAAEITLPHAVTVEPCGASMTFGLSDGRTISFPLIWCPRLADATPAERNNWRLVGAGEGVQWPDLDEDISVDAIVPGKPSAEAPASLERWRSARRSSHG